MSERPLWFGPTDRPRAGWLHVPPDGRARGGVVLCPTLGYEYLAAHRAFRDLAGELAGAGIAALRFDYDGTGDAAGDDHDPDRVASWIASIGDAVELLWSCGVADVVAVGLRVGAALACCAARELDLAGVVLWDPVPSGRAFVRELRALQLLGLGDAAGEVYSDALLDELRSLKVPRLDDGLPVLALTRPDRPVTKAFDDVLPPTATREAAVGQAALLDGFSSAAITPVDTVARIVEWVGEQLPPVRGDVHVPESSPVAPVDGAVQETFLRIGPVRLFAIRSESLARRPDAPVVVLLNIGNDHHVGPARQWVEWGRQLAHLGFSVVRVDLSGIGDSPTRPGQRPDKPYAPETVDDIVEVAQALDRGTGVVLVGVCSGARLALEAARRLTGDVVRGVCSVNPALHIPIAALHDTTREELDPPAVVAANKHGHVRHHALVAVPDVAWRWLDRRDRVPSRVRLVEDVVANDIDTLLVYGEHDHFLPRIEEMSMWAVRRLQRDPRFRFDVVPGLDHALLARGGRTELMARLTAHLVERFGQAVGTRATRWNHATPLVSDDGPSREPSSLA